MQAARAGHGWRIDYADRTPEVDGETKNHTTLRSLLSVFCVSRPKSLNKHRIFF